MDKSAERGTEGTSVLSSAQWNASETIRVRYDRPNASAMATASPYCAG